MVNYIYIISSKDNQKEDQYKLSAARYIKETDEISLGNINYTEVNGYYIIDRISCFDPLKVIEKVEKSFNSKNRIIKAKYTELKKELLKFLIEEIETKVKEQEKEIDILSEEMSKIRILLKEK
jgi:hypothetical protein